jgi:hypothetical protein
VNLKLSDSPSHLLDVAESVGKINESIMGEIPDVVIDIRHKLIENGERSETIRDSMTQLYNWKGEAKERASQWSADFFLEPLKRSIDWQANGMI